MSRVEKPSSSARLFLILLGPLIAGFVGLFSEAALNVVLPDFMTLFRISAATVQWLTTGYLLVVGVLLPMSSLLVRWFTTRQLVFTVLGCFLVGAVVSAVAVDFPMLIVGRLIQGIATGILVPLIFSTAIAAFPPQRRGSALGLVGLVLMFAPAISPVLAGLILEIADWRWIFWLMLPVIMVSFVVCAIFLRNVREITRPHVDVISIVLSTIGFGPIVFGVSSAGDAGWGSPMVIVALVVGVAALVLFTHRQLRLSEPVLDVRAFAHRNYALSASMIFVVGAMLMCTIYLIPMYLEQGLALTALLAGLIMLPGGVVNGAVSVWAGHAADVHRPWILARLGFAAAILGGAVLLFIGQSTPVWVLIVAHCILMIGVPLAMTSAQTFGLNDLPHALGADGSTIISTLQQVGGAIGTAVGASLLTAGRHLAAETGPAATATGTRLGFLFTLMSAAAGLMLALLLRGRPIEESAGR